jgi:hypothetical protein
MDEIARVVRKVVQRVASTTRLEWPSSYEHWQLVRHGHLAWHRARLVARLAR